MNNTTKLAKEGRPLRLRGTLLTGRSMLSRSISVIALLASAAAGQGISSTGVREPSYNTAQEAAEAEEQLKSNPEDQTAVKRLLDYYVQRWQNAGSDRLRVVLWAIQNIPASTWRECTIPGASC
jgi:hypothetical protein